MLTYALGQVLDGTWTSDCQAPGQVPSPKNVPNSWFSWTALDEVTHIGTQPNDHPHCIYTITQVRAIKIFLLFTLLNITKISIIWATLSPSILYGQLLQLQYTDWKGEDEFLSDGCSFFWKLSKVPTTFTFYHFSNGWWQIYWQITVL